MICKICKINFMGFKHLKTHNISSKNYYDIFFKKECDEGVCLVCNKETKFISMNKGYKPYCSARCFNTATKTGKPSWNKNIPFDKETKNKMSIEKIKHWQNPEYIENRKKTHKISCNTKDFKEHQKICTSNNWNNNSLFIEKMQNRKNSYVSGKYFSEKNNCELFYQSSYELQAFKILEQIEEIKSYKKCLFSIDYVNPKDNEIHKYIPDIEVIYKSGNKQIIEIKPNKFLEDQVVLAKAMAAKNIFGNNYTIWSEKELGI